jgi:drug/metabolite transporter (DMT)-like permease
MMPDQSTANQSKRNSDGTLPLLCAGGGVFGFGLVCALLVLLLGQPDMHGPHTNSGWLALVFAIGCLPLGAMLLLLGSAKWLGGRKH